MAPATLPQAAWRRLPGLERLLDALGSREGSIRFVGGCVRDAMLGGDPSDIDCATVHHPHDAIRLAEDAGFKTIATGLSHGTFTAMLPRGEPVEITTLRTDVETDGRHATVAYTTDWAIDAARRDFTFNALSANPIDGAVYDYFGGISDLSAGTVKFVGDADERIAEDLLRIMRFYRFQARFGRGDADHAARAACRAGASGIDRVSIERIRTELLKILALPDPREVLAMMADDGIMAAIGFADRPVPDALIAREIATGSTPDPILRLAALTGRMDPRGSGRRLKLSNRERDRIVTALTGDRSDPTPALVHRIGHQGALDRLMLDPAADLDEILRESRIIREEPERSLPLGGGDLIRMGIPRGPSVSIALRRLEDAWIDAGFPDADGADAIARTIVAEYRACGID